MTDNLYDLLGLKPTCMRVEIKRAFRKLAAAHHPDHGGDRDTFEKIKFAYEVLTDELRRAEYDRTGHAPQKNAVNDVGPILVRISGVLDMAMQRLEQTRGGLPGSVDMIARMSEVFDLAGKERDQIRERGTKILAQYRSMLGRFKSREGDNEMESIIKQKITAGEAQIQGLEMVDKLDKSSREFLKRFGFDYDRQIGYQMAPSPVIMMQTAGGIFHFGANTSSTGG